MNEKALLDKAVINFVLGPAGVGKGTMCAMLKEEFGFVHLSAGSLLRQEASRKTDLSEELNRMMKEGVIVPAPITVRLLKEEILRRVAERPEDTTRFLVDGFPRSVDQGEHFVENVKECDFVLFLDGDNDILLERLRSRSVSSGRVDDNEESFMKRIEVYKEQCMPAILAYEERGMAKTVDCNGTIEENYSRVRELYL